MSIFFNKNLKLEINASGTWFFWYNKKLEIYN